MTRKRAAVAGRRRTGRTYSKARAGTDVVLSRQTTDRRTGGAAQASPIRLPRVPKGRRAQFFDDAAIDQLFAIVAALTAELSVVSERMMTLEKLLESAEVLRQGALEQHAPGEAEQAARAAAREALIERVFQVLEAYTPAPK